MNAQRVRWFAVSSPETNLLRCVACEDEINVWPSLDHHPAICPRCGIESAFLNWESRIIQIVPKYAPPSFVAMLKWMQKHLDEIEYVEFLCSLAEVAKALNGAVGGQDRDSSCQR